MSTYNQKKIFRAVSNDLLVEFFKRYAPELEVDWEKVKARNVDALYFGYLRLPDTRRAVIDSLLHELHTVAERPDNAVTLHALLNEHGLNPPDAIRDGVIHDLAMWIMLENESAWTHAARFAHTDKMAQSLWFVKGVEDGGDPEPDEYEDERFDRLRDEVCAYVYTMEGRGKHGHVEYFERDGRHEYFFVYLSNHACSVMQWREKNEFERGIDHASYEIVFIYDREKKQISLRTSGSKDHKARLCELWADVMRDAVIHEENPEKPVFSINSFKERGTELAPDASGDVVEAEVVSLEIGIKGYRGSRRVYEELDGDLYDKMEREINQKTLPRSLMEVHKVKIRVTLDDDFGRSRRQTLTITADHCDLQNKNPKVREILAECLQRWKIAA